MNSVVVSMHAKGNAYQYIVSNHYSQNSAHIPLYSSLSGLYFLHQLTRHDI